MAKGRVKAGEGSLVGNAGEYYVVAELLKRGIIAALAPRNAPAFDILATKGDRTTRVRVKTKSSEYDEWQWQTKKDGTIFRDLHAKDDHIVLVNLTPAHRQMAFFVLPTAKIDEMLKARFDRWAKAPGKNGRKHDATTKKRTLSYKESEATLKPFLDEWDGLWSKS